MPGNILTMLLRRRMLIVKKTDQEKFAYQYLPGLFLFAKRSKPQIGKNLVNDLPDCRWTNTNYVLYFISNSATSRKAPLPPLFLQT